MARKGEESPVVVAMVAKLRNHQRGLKSPRLSLIDKFDGPPAIYRQLVSNSL